MVGRVQTVCFHGFESFPVFVEADLLHGPMQTQILGLGDNAVKESKDRIRAAIQNSGYEYPSGYILVNLAPNDRPKEGSGAELAIAIAILIASEQLPQKFAENAVFLGALHLDGRLHSPYGLLNCVIRAGQDRRTVFIPQSAVKEMDFIPGLFTLERLADIRNNKFKPFRKSNAAGKISIKSFSPDMSEIAGQASAKHALAYGAIGRHHLLLMGSPGTGKSMLARAFEGLLPPLSLEQALQTTQIYSLCGLLKDHIIRNPPFRTPHHTSSEIALVGGGSIPKPGEASLSHNGILFLDELLEFRSSTLQALREPLEEKKITISRAKAAVVFPADFILIGAANPCRCGYLFCETKVCLCTPAQVRARQQKIAGPFLDRISLEVEVKEEPHQRLSLQSSEASTGWWRSKISEALNRMKNRNGNIPNGSLPVEKILPYIQKIQNWENLIESYSVDWGLSRRSILNTLRLAMSIMDYKETSSMTKDILEEAFSYRYLTSFQKSYPELVA